MTILTTAQFRAFEETELGDIPLQTLLDAAEIEIVRFAGDPTTAVEWMGGGQYIYLYRPASAITSITETVLSTGTVTTLAADDYELSPDGFRIRRLNTGTNARSYWYGRVAVTYTPTDDTALRKAVQVDLVKLMLNYSPGVTSETIGDWAETFASNSVWNNLKERTDILSRLSYGPSMVVV